MSLARLIRLTIQGFLRYLRELYFTCVIAITGHLPAEYIVTRNISVLQASQIEMVPPKVPQARSVDESSEAAYPLTLKPLVPPNIRTTKVLPSRAPVPCASY